MKTGPGTSHTHNLDLSTITPAELDMLRVRLGITTPATARAAVDAGKAAEMVKLTRTYAAATGTSVTVTTIPALLAALAVNANTEIVVKNGTYSVAGASAQLANSLWIGALFASRTNAVTVRAETPGGVTFDGANATYWIGLEFAEGAHDQTWDGFKFANGQPTSSAVLDFGIGTTSPSPYNITLRNMEILPSIVGRGPADNRDHAVYFGQNGGVGAHDILIDGLIVRGTGLGSAIQFYHSAVGFPNAWNVTIRNMTVTGTDQGVVFWDTTARDLVIEDSTITSAGRFAIRYEQGVRITLRRVTSTNSGTQGFYSSLGAAPSEVTFISSSLA